MNEFITLSISCGVLLTLFALKALELRSGKTPWYHALRTWLDMLCARGCERMAHYADIFIRKGLKVVWFHVRRICITAYVRTRDSVEQSLITLLKNLHRRQQVRKVGDASQFLQHVGEHKSNLRNRV